MKAVTYRLPEDLIERVQAKSEATGLTKTKIVVAALEREVGAGSPRVEDSVSDLLATRGGDAEGEREDRDSATTFEDRVQGEIHKLNGTRPAWTPQMRRAEAQKIVAKMQADGLPVRVGDEA